MQDLPIGISEFSELRETDCLYVDKTKLVYSLLKKNRRTCLARPRRFGKSLLVSTLEAALQGEKELFKYLWIANSDYSWEPKGVLRFDLTEKKRQKKRLVISPLPMPAKNFDEVTDFNGALTLQ